MLKLIFVFLVLAVVNSDNYLINTPSCKIEDLKLYDPTIKHYFRKPYQVNCNKGIPPLWKYNTLNFHGITFMDDHRKYYGIDHYEFLHCCYKSFDQTYPLTDPLREYTYCWNLDRNYTLDHLDRINWRNWTSIPSEFILVECRYHTNLIYIDTFAFVQNKTYLVEEYPRDYELNVLVLGMSGVSRLNLLRQMPQTVKYLKSLGAISMLGYNKVADSSYQNRIPMLTGLAQTKFNFNGGRYIWDDYKKAKFITAIGEDTGDLGLGDFSIKRLKKPPADYFWNPFNRFSNKIIGNKKNLNLNQCVGSRLVHETLLNYIKKYVNMMIRKQKKYFGYFWQTGLTHGLLNQPALGDEDYLKLFEYLHISNALNNTAVLFLSDHGMRFGQFRKSANGALEIKLPFLYILMPKWYLKKHTLLHKNLKINTKRFTTTYDIYETLKDLVYSDYLTNKYLNSKPKINKFGYSLFQEVHKYRGCANANIPNLYCACKNDTAIKMINNQMFAQRKAEVIIDIINDKISSQKKCSHLKFEKVWSMRTNGYYKDREYALTFSTQPGNFVFETVFKEVLHPWFLKDIKAINRVNVDEEGNKFCINDPDLKYFCHCK